MLENSVCSNLNEILIRCRTGAVEGEPRGRGRRLQWKKVKGQGFKRMCKNGHE